MDNLGYKILVSIPGYEILDELGRGGMSTVYLATQESLQRRLALKVMAATLSVDPSFKDRFMREGRTLGQLSHPNIVIIYDIGLSANRYFIAMEYVGGGTLGERIARGLALDESLRILKAIGRALHYAHRRGFVHRDVKPSNILFRDDDTPVLADFGIARSLDSNTRLTKTGLSVGTPNYMSPEQVSGHKVDGRSDLYSLGIVFYEMLTGEPPYEAESAIATSLKHLTEPVPKLPPHLDFLQPVLERMLAKAPDNRFSDVQACLEMLERLAAHHLAAPPDDATELADRTLVYHQTAEQHQEPRSPPPAEPDQPASRPRPGPSRLAWLAAVKGRRGWQLSVGLAVLGLLAALAALLMRPAALPEHIQLWVDERLRMADEQMAQGQLLEPPANNAFDTYQQILAVAPGYKQALTGLQQIAEQFLAKARAQHQAREAEASLALIAQGLQALPEHEGLLSLRDTITQQLEAEQRQREIAELLDKAERQFEAWRLVEPEDDNAWQSYRAVLDRDPHDQQALQGLQRISARLERLARTKHSSGDLTGALDDVKKGLKVDPQHAGLRTLKQRLTVALQLEKAEQQLREGRLITPSGENAFETYQTVLSEQPDNESARAGLERIAAQLTDLARRDWEAARSSEAHERLDTGLRLFKGLPGHDGLQTLAGEIERQQKLTRLLAQAEAQFKEGQLFEPEGKNALTNYQQALALEPENVQALGGLAAIADHQATRAKRLEEAGDLGQALAAIGQGLMADPEHRGLKSLEAAVKQALETQQRLADLMAQAKDQFEAGRFTQPPGHNAYESYREVLGIEPDHDAARRGIQAIPKALEERARQQQSAGAIQQSLALVEQGLKIEAQHPPLIALRQELLDQITTLERQQRTAALLDRAKAQLQADQLTAPPGDNADASYREVLVLDPGNAQAIAGRQRIAVRLAELAQQQRVAGEFEASLDLIRQGIEIAPKDPTLRALVDDVTQRLKVRGEVTALLDKAEKQLAATRLTEPAGDNAYDSYRKVLRREPGNEKALAGFERIAERLAALAEQRERAGQLDESLALIAKGLAIAPDHRSLLTLQESIQQRMEAERQRQQRIARLLQQAEQRRSEDRLAAPEKDNAYDAYRQVLALDPGNEEARAGIEAIVERFRDLAQDQRDNGRLEESLALIDRGLGIDEKNSALRSLKDEVSQTLAVKERDQETQRLLTRAETQWESGQLLAPKGENAHETYQQVLSLDPGNERALIGLHRLAEHQAALASEHHAASELAEARRLVDEGLGVAPWHPRLLALQRELGTSPPPEPKLPREVPLTELIAKAKQQMAGLKLTSPAGDNAYETLQAVLARDPDHREAKAMLSDIAERYATWANRRLQQGNSRDALTMVERGLRVDPQHRDLLALQQQLTRPAPQPDTAIASLLAKAERQLAAGRGTKPPGDNAFETLTEILQREPGHRQAQAGLRTLAAQYEVSIREALQKGNAQEALARVTEGLKFFPEHTGLAALEHDIAKRQGEQVIASLLAQAARQLEAQRWTHPPGDNAFETLQKIRRLDPDNRQAATQLASIPPRCEQLARAARQSGDTDKALSAVQECLRFFPREASLIALRDELQRPAVEPKTTDLGALEELPPEAQKEKAEEPKPRTRRVFGTF